MTPHWLAALAAGALAAGSAHAEGDPARLVNARMVNPGTPAPECVLHVNYDRNVDLPGYRDGGACVPFTLTNQLIPPGRGADFYLTEFTDAAIRARWERCRADDACRTRAVNGAKPFIAYEPRRTGTVDPEGRIDPEGAVDLRAVRRPGFFGAPRFAEPVAVAEPHAYTVEFTVPRDSYERRHLGKTGSIKLRGWYLVGAGVPDGVASGAGRRRALVILNNGGGSELTATDDPRSPGVMQDAAGRWVQADADGISEQPGMRHWRGFVAALNGGGFDVLVTDRRGNGISGGVAGFNTAEQANDMFRELDQLGSGDGLRLVTPRGEVREGAAAAGVLPGGVTSAEIPTVLAGYSRGSYATAWAMQKNFVADCDRDVPDGGCRPPLGRANIRGAILYGPNSAGLGYRLAGHDMVEAVLRTEYNTTYYPDSEVAAGVAAWPGLAIIKGTWDYVEGLEGSLDTFRRARAPKDIFVFRGPHPLQTQDGENMRLAGARMVAFARAAVLGQERVEGGQDPADLRALVLSSPGHWERTTAPGGR